MKLPDEKKKRIFDAIYDEITRVPFPEMSINRVIKGAGIPRGSFYQYFNNKEDAFNYFVTEVSSNLKVYLSNKILSVHGDIFEIAEEILVSFVKEAPNVFGPDVIKHSIPYIDVKKISPFSDYIFNLSEEKRLQTFSALGIGSLKVKSEEEILDILSIIEALFHSIIPIAYVHPEYSEKLCCDFKRRLAIIKRAVT